MVTLSTSSFRNTLLQPYRPTAGLFWAAGTAALHPAPPALLSTLPTCLCRQLPAVPGRPLQDKEEQGKVIPLVTPRMVDFIAAAVEANRRVRDTHCCSASVLLNCRKASLLLTAFLTARSHNTLLEEK